LLGEWQNIKYHYDTFFLDSISRGYILTCIGGALDKYGEAHYDLYELKDLLKNPATRIITGLSRREAVSVGYASSSDMVKRVQELRKNEIYKTMESEKVPGLWQDVYRTNDGAIQLYIKLQKSFDGKGIIIQFKRK
jgi:motility quorum-sensing regulator/GCU-specific mRNA interferase toxin